MTENEVKPLFKGGADSAEFLCNIGGEVSLWRIGRGVGNDSSIRAYTADFKGEWLSDLQDHEAYIKKLGPYPAMREHAEILRRNMDAILVYAAMLGEKHSGVG